jgi:hypothetical protein
VNGHAAVATRNSATRPTDKRRMSRSLACLTAAVSLDGVSLFDIVPTVTDLLRESVFAAPCHLAQYGVRAAGPVLAGSWGLVTSHVTDHAPLLHPGSS